MTSPFKTGAIVKYAFATRRLFFILIPIALVVTLVDYFINQWSELNTLIKIWNDFISPLIGITTLIVALSVWFAELMQDWRNDIPKKLTVIFRFHGKEVMRCNHAELSSEADIRQLGQQIGLQMAGVKFLKFKAPLVKQVKKEVSFANETGFFMDYEVVFELTEPPEGLNPEKCLLWEPPFSEKPSVISQPAP